DEAERRQGSRRAEPRGIAPENARASLQSEHFDITADYGARFRRHLDEDAKARPARQRLKAERASPGKEIEDTRAFDQPGIAMLQNIEQGLAHLVGGRTGGL